MTPSTSFCIKINEDNFRWMLVNLILFIALQFFIVVKIHTAFYISRFSRPKTSFNRYFTSSLRMQNSDLPLRMPENVLKHINSWCGLQGLMYTDGKLNWYPAPISLAPNRFSRSAFQYAQTIQPIWNKLVDRIARDRTFLINELEEVVKADDFTRRVLDIYVKIPEETLKTGLQFGLFRSDYMLNHDNRVLQVEINTIAASFGCLSRKVASLHQHLLARYPTDPHYSSLVQQLLETNAQAVKENLQENHSLERLAAGLAAAHRVSGKGEESVLLFIVQPGERNQGDQRALESRLWESHAVKVEFLTLEEAYDRVSVEENSSDLLLQSLSPTGESIQTPISVVYYRAGYTPNDYPSEKEWIARERMELSSAIKCPNAGYHLAGTKAIQAALCKPSLLEKYLRPDESELLRQCFAEQFALGDPEQRVQAEGALAEAMKDGSKWVLKPQREGGGNNYYNTAVSQFLQENTNQPTLQGYVLMQRIFPNKSLTAFYRQGEVAYAPSISELGVYGAYLGYAYDPEDPSEGALLNEYCGYLLRTKAEGVDEGGVATGYSVLNSITLVDE